VVVRIRDRERIEASNVQPVGWSLDAWSLGPTGYCPGKRSAGSVLETGRRVVPLLPRPEERRRSSAVGRLKAYRRGQQDVEYLTLWRLLRKEPQWAVGHSVRAALRLAGERTATVSAAAKTRASLNTGACARRMPGHCGCA